MMPSPQDGPTRTQARHLVLSALAIGVVTGAMGARTLSNVAFATPAPADTSYVFRPDSACVRMVDSLSATFHAPMDPQMRQDTTTLWYRTQRCAWSEDERLRMQMVAIAKPTALYLATMHLQIPEYHDEQRLKGWDDPTDNRLGPIAGIFASPFLGEIAARSQIRAHRTPGMLAAFVVVMREGSEPLPPNYSNLGLDWGMNCVWLQVDNSMNNFTAFVTHVADDDADNGCRGTLRAGSPAPTPLRVYRTAVPPDMNAPATRFTDDQNGNPMLGIPCFDGWCDLGRPAGLQPRAPAAGLTVRPSYASSGDSYSRKETRVKGWYDEQNMEQRTPAGWVLTGVRAAIVPRPNLNRLNRDSYVDTWVHVADIFVEGTPGPGPKTLNFLKAGWNKVELTNDVAGHSGYKFRYTSADEGSRYVAYVPGSHLHMDAPVPGTTRWRYTLLDPGTWSPCGDNACCSTGGS